MSKENTTNYKIKIANNLDDVSAYWPDGYHQETSQFSFMIFQTLPFLKAWSASYGKQLNAQVLLVEIYDQNDKPLLFIPFALFKKFGVLYLTFPDEGVADYNAPIIFHHQKQWSKQEAEDLLSSVISALPDFDILSLPKMPEFIDDEINPLFHLCKQDHKEQGHYMRLNSTWENIQKNLHRGKNTRQKQRQLQRLGVLKYVVAQNYAQAESILASLIKQKQHRFEQTYVPGFKEHPEKQIFFEEATKEFLKCGHLHLCALTLDDSIIATLWGLRQQHAYYGMMISYDAESWGKFSPGMVLHYYLLRDLYEQGVTKLDLGIGDEAWKTGLCAFSTKLRDHNAAYSLRGSIILQCIHFIEKARKTWLWRKIRPLKWVILRAIKR